MKSGKPWYTCTPVRFTGGEAYFARDSGLLCKGFQENGIDCKAIMPGPAVEGDNTEDLIRTDYQNLEDPAWWRGLNGEGVVFYAWGAGKYRAIARAIRESGMILVTHIDSAGIFSIFNGAFQYMENIWQISIGKHGHSLKAFAVFASRMIYAVSVGLIRNDWMRAKHLKQAHLIGAISPIAVERIKKVCRVYGGADLANRVHLIPHPNASYMKYDPAISKERLIVAIGRWDDEKIKGTDLLKATCMLSLEKDETVQIEIYGKVPASMHSWHESLDSALRSRLHLKGIVPNFELRHSLQRAQVELCTSLSEGYHTVSAEALCCGCSVVGPDVPQIPSLKWFTQYGHGKIAKRDPLTLSDAVLSELSAWDQGLRDPIQISSKWTDVLHAPNISKTILHLKSHDDKFSKHAGK